MLIPRFGVSVFCVGLTMTGTCVAADARYPAKPIRIVTAEAGGGGDVVSRIIAPGLTASLGQQIVVDNRGGNAVIPAEIVAKASPDGHTLFVTGNTHWIYPLMKNVPYDPVKDYSPVTITTSSPSVIAVSTVLPVNSIKELVALAKAKPGALNYASGVDGSTTHLASELFKAVAGVNILRITYKGAAPAVIALVQNEVQMMSFPTSTGAPYIKSGRVKGLAVASIQPSALAPGLPTVAAAGLPGCESGTLHAVFAPAKTPKAIIDLLNREIVQYINTPDSKSKLFNSGLEILGSSPEQSAVIIKSEMDRLGKVIRDARIHVE